MADSHAPASELKRSDLARMTGCNPETIRYDESVGPGSRGASLDGECRDASAFFLFRPAALLYSPILPSFSNGGLHALEGIREARRG